MYLVVVRRTLVGAVLPREVPCAERFFAKKQTTAFLRCYRAARRLRGYGAAVLDAHIRDAHQPAKIPEEWRPTAPALPI